MQKSKLLMTPGPSNVPYNVLTETARPLIHHRTDEFSAIFSQLNERLKYVFRTNETVMTFPSSGTGMIEASIVNLFSPKDVVIVVSIGVFGDRFAKIGEIFGLDVRKLTVEWGRAVEVNQLQEFILANNDAKAVIITYNETSTAISNDIEAVAKLTNKMGKLLIVDAVSALGGLPLEMDEWGVDVVISASQKALMIPPGLGFAALSKRAWEFAENSKLPKFYWDFKAARKGAVKEKPDNPYTPAISLITGANEALGMICDEGLDNVLAKHKKLAAIVRKALKELGLPLYPVREEYSSDVLTAVKSPEGLDIPFDKVRGIMNKKYNIMVAGGQAHLKGKILRIGHMGYFDVLDIISTFSALEMALYETGYKDFALGSSIKTIMTENLN